MVGAYLVRIGSTESAKCQPVTGFAEHTGGKPASRIELSGFVECHVQSTRTRPFVRVLHQRRRFACAGISDDTGQATRLAVDDRRLLRGALQIGGHALVARSGQGSESRGGLIASRNALIGRHQTPGNSGNTYHGLGGVRQRRAMFSERCVAVHADTIASGMGETHVGKILKKQKISWRPFWPRSVFLQPRAQKWTACTKNGDKNYSINLAAAAQDFIIGGCP